MLITLVRSFIGNSFLCQLLMLDGSGPSVQINAYPWRLSILAYSCNMLAITSVCVCCNFHQNFEDFIELFIPFDTDIECFSDAVLVNTSTLGSRANSVSWYSMNLQANKRYYSMRDGLANFDLTVQMIWCVMAHKKGVSSNTPQNQWFIIIVMRYGLYSWDLYPWDLRVWIHLRSLYPSVWRLSLNW